MKIEKLDNNNLNEFIKHVNFNDTDYIKKLSSEINKTELFALKDEDTYYIGFESKFDNDTISLLYFNEKMSDNKFFECIDYLNNSLVVDNHLIILTFEDKYIKLLEEKYRCREVLMTYGSKKINIVSKGSNKEKYIEIGMNSIKYTDFNGMITCNLLKQNIQDENMVLNLFEEFKKNKVSIINFIVNIELFDFLVSLGFECICKSFIVK